MKAHLILLNGGRVQADPKPYAMLAVCVGQRKRRKRVGVTMIAPCLKASARGAVRLYLCKATIVAVQALRDLIHGA